MSGPKCLSLIPPARLARLQAAQDETERMIARYARRHHEVAQWQARMVATGMEPTRDLTSPEEVRTRVQYFLAQWMDEEAVSHASFQLNMLEKSLVESQTALLDTVEERQRIADELARDWGKWMQELKAIGAALTKAARHAGFSRELNHRLTSDLKTLTITHAPPPAFIQPTLVQLQNAEARLAEAQQALHRLRDRLDGEINSTHAQSVREQLAGDGARELEEILAGLRAKAAAQGKSHTVAAEPETTLEIDMSAKLSKLFFQIAALQETAGWQALLDRAEAVRAEEDPARRRMLYEDLILSAGERLKALRTHAHWLEELDLLLDSAAHVRGADGVEEIVAKIEETRRAGHVEPATELAVQMRAAIVAAEQNRERERRRRAVLESLEELGYEVQEGMETALAEGGKLVVRRPEAASEYAVEVVANAELSLLQTAMVRYTAAPEEGGMSEQQRLRDTEEETAWCADHAALRQGLARRGIDSHLEMHQAAGEHPVRVVFDPERAEEERSEVAKPRVRVAQD